MHGSYPPPSEDKRLVSQSSIVGDYEDSLDRPGSSALWIGDEHHLSREEVAEFVEHLNAWLKTGSLEVVEETEGEPSQEEKKLPVLWCLVIHDDGEVVHADAFTAREAAEKWKEGNQKANSESVDSWQRVEPYIPAQAMRELRDSLKEIWEGTWWDTEDVLNAVNGALETANEVLAETEG